MLACSCTVSQILTIFSELIVDTMEKGSKKEKVSQRSIIPQMLKACVQLLEDLCFSQCVPYTSQCLEDCGHMLLRDHMLSSQLLHVQVGGWVG